MCLWINNGTPPHFLHVRKFLKNCFLGWRIRFGGPHNWSATSPDLNSLDYSVRRWMKKWFIAKLQDAMLGPTLDAADRNRNSLCKLHCATCAAHNWVARFTVSLGGISENMLQAQVSVNWRKFHEIRLHSYFKSIKFFNYFFLCL
jgi:hypothetical protein